MSRLTLLLGIILGGFGMLWLFFISPFQFYCPNYVPPFNTSLSCPDVNFLLFWMAFPLLIVGILLLIFYSLREWSRPSEVNTKKSEEA